MTLYLSGPISGRDLLEAATEFFNAERTLRNANFDVFNPWSLDGPTAETAAVEAQAKYDDGWTWENFMARDLANLADCDQVCVLPGWEQSKGSRTEVAAALSMGKQVWPYKPLWIQMRGTFVTWDDLDNAVMNAGVGEMAADVAGCLCDAEVGEPCRPKQPTVAATREPPQFDAVADDVTAVEDAIDITAAEQARQEMWVNERQDVLDRYTAELAKATGDGSKKRQANQKPPWYRDDTHEAAVYSHLMKWKRGELADPDSGAHPLVHAAWRLLAIACRENGNNPDWESRSE